MKFLLAAMIASIGGCVSRAESDVVAYVSVDQEFATPILDAFERSSDQETTVVATFDVESTKTVGLVNRIIAERSRPIADVFWNNEVLHMIRLQQSGLLAPHDFAVPSNFPRDMIASDSTWCGFAARARVLMINTDRLPNPNQWPASVDDLADPKWKDACAMARPLFGTCATHFAVMAAQHGNDAAIAQMRAIKENTHVLSGNKQVALSVSSGQHAWGLVDTDDAVIEVDQGYPVAIVFPDQQPGQPGTMRIPNTAAIVKGASHPVAAGKLVDYLVTPQTEERLAMGDSAQIPMLGNPRFQPRVLPSHSVRWMRVDFEAAAANWDAWMEQLVPLFD